MRRTTTWLAAGILCVCALHLAGLAQDDPGQAKQRAKPPKFGNEVNRIFFDNVFSKLQGERPKNPGAVVATSAPGGGSAGTGGSADGASYAWSKMISATTIENEIKAIKLNVDQSVTTPSEFAGRGHKQVRRDFSILAAMFGIVGEYDGDVRWKKMGPAARDVFARTARNTKAGGNTNTYNESKQRKNDLQDLLGGASLQAEAEQADADWSTICDRGPLMQRLDRGFEGKLNGWVSNKAEFDGNLEDVLHEAEMVAALSEVLTKEGMEDWEDETYLGFAKRMKEGAMAIAAAVKTNDYEQARQAAGDVKKACTECHEFYR